MARATWGCRWLKTFPTDKIRNVALVGHGGAGKTTLAEALLFVAGAIPRLGRVEDGNTVSDFDPEEQRRRISVSLALAPFELDGHKVNLLDTPGLRRLRRRRRRRAARRRPRDLRRVGGRGRRGADRGRVAAWPRSVGIPRAIFVNKLDRERASFARTLDQLKDKFGAGVAPLAAPDRRGGRRSAASSTCSTDTAVTYDGDVAGTGTDGRDPDRDGDRGARGPRRARSRASSSPTTTSWSATSTTRRSTSTSSRHALAKGIADGDGVPGAVRQRDEAHRHRPARALHRRGGARRRRVGDGPAAAFVFKTIVDPYVGRVNLFKVLQGTVKHDDVARERPHASPTSGCTSSSRCAARSRTPSTEVAAGDIAAVAKLNDTTHRRRARGASGADVDVEPFAPPEPVLAGRDPRQVEGRRGQARQRAAPPPGRGPGAAHRAQPRDAPDAALGHGRDAPRRSRSRSCARKFGVEVETEDVKVAYRETITGTAEAEGKYKKQTGGHGQFGGRVRCASSRSSAARASSSSTRSSAA